MNKTFDSIIGTGYIKLKNGRIHQSIEISDEVFLDLDESNNIVGIEFLNIKDHLDAWIFIDAEDCSL